jgi:hypothetical protein
VCSPGKASDAGSEFCESCRSLQEFAPFEGMEYCRQCPVHASVVNDTRIALDHSTCQCQPNYLTIPFARLDLLQRLDSGQSVNYLNTIGTTESWDAHRVTGFWCVLCPPGAGCSSPNTTLATVTTLHGYFKGLDGSNASFFECLNEACLAGSLCADGYRGPCLYSPSKAMLKSHSFLANLIDHAALSIPPV